MTALDASAAARDVLARALGEHYTENPVPGMPAMHYGGASMVLAALEQSGYTLVRRAEELDRETLRQVIHDEYERTSEVWGCAHRNQHRASWDCEKRTREIVESARAVLDRKGPG